MRSNTRCRARSASGSARQRGARDLRPVRHGGRGRPHGLDALLPADAARRGGVEVALPALGRPRARAAAARPRRRRRLRSERHSEMRAIWSGPTMPSAEQEAERQLRVLPGHGRAHRDRQPLAAEADLERLLAGDQVGAALRRAPADPHHRHALGRAPGAGALSKPHRAPPGGRRSRPSGGNLPRICCAHELGAGAGGAAPPRGAGPPDGRGGARRAPARAAAG